MQNEELIIIGTIQGELAAHVIKTHLESKNIRVLLQYESVIRTHGIVAGDLGEVRILVPKSFAKEAKQIIGNKSGFLPISEDDEYIEDIDKNSRPILIHKAAKPYKEIESDAELEYLLEVLSCTTCGFYNEEAFQRGKPWCNAPHPPEIENNYCITFKPKRQ